MLEIEYRGGNTVVISTKDLNIVTDPNRSVIGQSNVVISGGVELATEKRLSVDSEEYRVSICGAGEYEVADIEIRGIAAVRALDDPSMSVMDSAIYRIKIQDVTLCLVGNIHYELSDNQLDEVGPIDILVIPVGGNGYTLDAQNAAQLTRKIEPKIVIPIHYANKALDYEVSQDDVEQFIQQLKATVVEDKKIKIKSSASLPTTLEIHKLDFIK